MIFATLSEHFWLVQSPTYKNAIVSESLPSHMSSGEASHNRRTRIAVKGISPSKMIGGVSAVNKWIVRDSEAPHVTPKGTEALITETYGVVYSLY